MILLVANGDLRQSANQICWARASRRWSAPWAPRSGVSAAAWCALIRTNPPKKHGFNRLAKRGHAGFSRGSIRTAAADRRRGGVAVFRITCSTGSSRTAGRSSPWPTGAAPGRAWSACSTSTVSLTKGGGVPYSTLWSEDFSPTPIFQKGLARWLKTGRDHARHRPR